VKWIVWSLWLGIFLVSGAVCAEPVVQEASVAWEDDESENNEIGSKQIIGMVETVYLQPGGLLIDARIDTGANTTSIGAQNIEIINEDGQRWAEYTVQGVSVRSKVIKIARIKQHGAAAQRRAVVMANITLGGVTQTVKATLSDRHNFKYKVLIGVNFLKDHFIVDVSRKHTVEPEPKL